jgi:uncharacterized protein
MNEMYLYLTNGTDSLACQIADSFWTRFMGLMGRDRLPDGEGLLIAPCDSIHMFFMKFALDVLFLDKDFRIVKIVKNLKPGDIVGTVKGAWQVVEVAAGEVPGSFQEGITLKAERR